ncbi:MAG: hypothetical protein AAGI68_06755 [Planctomycetota bacterium]
MNGLIRVWLCGVVGVWGLVGASGAAVAEQEAVDWQAWGVEHGQEAGKLASKVFFADGEIGLGLVARGDLHGLAGQTLSRLGDAAGTEVALAAMERTRKGMAEAVDRAGLDWVRADVLGQLGRLDEARAVADATEDPVLRLLAQGLYGLALGESGDEAGMRAAVGGVMEALPAALKKQIDDEGWSDDWVMYQLVDMRLLAGDVEGALATAKAVPDEQLRQETLGRVAMGLVESGRVGEARRLVESVEAYMEKMEAEARAQGGLDECEDCVDVGTIRIEVVGAWSALGEWDRAKAQVERSDPEWPSEKAESLSLMAVYMTGPEQVAARRQAFEQAVGMLGGIESDWDKAWSAFYVGRDIARSGDLAAAQLLVEADKRPIVKGYAHAGLAWGVMMRVAPKRLGAGLADGGVGVVMPGG